MEQGFITLHRKLLKSFFYKDSEAVHLWVHLLYSANYTDSEFMLNGRRKKLEKGQLITGRKKLAEETGIDANKIYRLLKTFKSEQLIEQQTFSKYSIITILNYSKYQTSEQQNEQQVNNKRTTSEQQVNTIKQSNKNNKNNNKENNNINIITKKRKKSYGEFNHVKMTDEEYKKLVDRFGKERADSMVERIDIYIEQKGKKYKNHYAVALNWFKKEEIKSGGQKTLLDF